ncbi:hypothetical protein AVEN_105489-1 [Araneus ventricosus]|uniref:Reverse transcriptase domain-containing protein n=1 Tax=Araneus ventricosus TaxID=182803 RepID=A0A4Y2GJ08_ARAVE|nr:hypothetical protein AVEN_105489-1 [Araneus ventricosus]
MLSWGWVHGVPPEAGRLSLLGSPCQGLTPLRVGRLPWVRSVSYVIGSEIVTVGVCQGCPQGSVLAPHIWNLYFNDILVLNNDQRYLQAYADDLALIIVDDSLKNLENKANIKNLTQNYQLATINLQVASEKTLAVVFRGNQNKNRQKKGVVNF